MKYTILLLAVMTLMACNNTKKSNTEGVVEIEEIIQVERPMDKEAYMSILVDDPEEEGEKILVGEIEPDYLQTERFSWFDIEAEAYKPDAAITSQLKEALKGKDVTVFMGTWCDDSQREVPRLSNVLSLSNFNGEFNMYAVSRDKDTPDGDEKGKNIEFVPTIIISENGKEIGRFVESAQETLEKDLLAIASGQDYKHIYEE